MFLNTTGEGAYAKQAILNCLIISACIFVHDKHNGSIDTVGFGHGPISLMYYALGEISIPLSLNFWFYAFFLVFIVIYYPDGSGKTILSLFTLIWIFKFSSETY